MVPSPPKVHFLVWARGRHCPWSKQLFLNDGELRPAPNGVMQTFDDAVAWQRLMLVLHIPGSDFVIFDSNSKLLAATKHLPVGGFCPNFRGSIFSPNPYPPRRCLAKPPVIGDVFPGLHKIFLPKAISFEFLHHIGSILANFFGSGEPHLRQESPRNDLKPPHSPPLAPKAPIFFILPKNGLV